MLYGLIPVSGGSGHMLAQHAMYIVRCRAVCGVAVPQGQLPQPTAPMLLLATDQALSHF